MNFSFAFLTDTANFDIPFHLIDWRVGDTYTRALLVCTLNTLLVSAAGIVAATLLGLLIGIMRLSDNWLVRNVALAFIEWSATSRSWSRSPSGTSVFYRRCHRCGKASRCREGRFSTSVACFSRASFSIALRRR